VVVVLAISMAAATYIAGAASDHWHKASREQTRWSAAAVEDVRFVYSEQAPAAFEVAELRTRKAALDRLAAQIEGVPLDYDIEAIAEDQTAHWLILQHAGVGGVLSTRYVNANGYDVVRALVDVRASTAKNIPARSDSEIASGDRLAAWSLATSLIPLPLVVAFFALSAILYTYRRTTRRRVVTENNAAELVPQPWGAPADDRALAVLKTCAWVLLTLVAPAQLWLSGHAQKYDAESSLRATQVSADIAMSNLFADFQTFTSDWVSAARNVANERQTLVGSVSKPAESAPVETLFASADQQAMPRLEAVASAMARRPGRSDDLDAATLNSLNSTPEQWKATLVRQQAAAEQQTRLGSRANALSLATLLVAVATTLLALTMRGRRSTILETTTGCLVGSAFLIALVALLTV
jgi:hypothetical protein